MFFVNQTRLFQTIPSMVEQDCSTVAKRDFLLWWHLQSAEEQPMFSSSLVNRGCVVVENWCNDCGSSAKSPIQQSAKAWHTCSECNPQPSLRPVSVNIYMCLCVYTLVCICTYMQLHCSLFSRVCIRVLIYGCLYLLILFWCAFSTFLHVRVVTGWDEHNSPGQAKQGSPL